MFRLFIISALLVLVGCSQFSSIKVTDPRTGIEYTVPKRLNDVPGIKELAKACAENAGRVVNRTVEVDGYFDADLSRCEPGCWDSFSKSDFQYLEFEVKAPKNYEFLQEEGFWRVSKQDKADSRCDQRIMTELKRYAGVRPRNLDFCVVFEKVDALKSQYGHESLSESTIIDGAHGSRIYKGSDRVLNLGNRQVVAEDTSFFLSSKNKQSVIGQQFVCESIGIPSSSQSLREEVIRPRI